MQGCRLPMQPLAHKTTLSVEAVRGTCGCLQGLLRLVIAPDCLPAIAVLAQAAKWQWQMAMMLQVSRALASECVVSFPNGLEPTQHCAMEADDTACAEVSRVLCAAIALGADRIPKSSADFFLKRRLVSYADALNRLDALSLPSAHLPPFAFLAQMGLEAANLVQGFSFWLWDEPAGSPRYFQSSGRERAGVLLSASLQGDHGALSQGLRATPPHGVWNRMSWWAFSSNMQSTGAAGPGLLPQKSFGCSV